MINKVSIVVSVDKDVVDKIEKMRGLITRSAYINHILRTTLDGIDD